MHCLLSAARRQIAQNLETMYSAGIGILANCFNLTSNAVNALEAYVWEGGSLVVIDGAGIVNCDSEEKLAARTQEIRQRKKLKREEIRRLLAESRSDVLAFMEEPELESVPGLLYDLDEFVENTNFDFEIAVPGHENIFNIGKYYSHIRSVLTWNPIHFSEIAPLEDNCRRDRAYRFITLIYMENDHEIQIKQHGDDLFIQRIYHEAHIKG